MTGRQFRFGHLALAVLFAFLSIFPSAAPAAEKRSESGKQLTISGNVEKAAIDEKGAVIAVEIWAEQDDTYDYYLVEDDAKGNELIPLVGKKIRATGMVEEDEDGNKIIVISSYTVLN